MILLDTNILAEMMKPGPSQAVVTWLDSMPVSDFCICAITRAEIELGIALLPQGRRRQGLAMSAQKMFSFFEGRCLPFEETATVLFASIFAARQQAGRPISTEDAQIAAIALVHGMKLATRNVKDFDLIDGLSLINPWNQLA